MPLAIDAIWRRQKVWISVVAFELERDTQTPRGERAHAVSAHVEG
jgi:hypothetical protein